MTRLATYNTRAKAKLSKAPEPKPVLEATVALKATESLWATSIMPEGCLERWRVADGARVHLGQALADLKIEGALHEIVAPAAGRLFQSAPANSVVEPGDLLGRLQTERAGV
jgi:hypothetical protein